jgi:hypothetical protein
VVCPRADSDTRQRVDTTKRSVERWAHAVFVNNLMSVSFPLIPNRFIPSGQCTESGGISKKGIEVED